MQKTFSINGKAYKIDDLSEEGKNILNNVSVIQGKIAEKQVDIQIYTLANDTLVEKLSVEVARIEEVITAEVVSE